MLLKGIEDMTQTDQLTPEEVRQVRTWLAQASPDTPPTPAPKPLAAFSDAELVARGEKCGVVKDGHWKDSRPAVSDWHEGHLNVGGVHPSLARADLITLIERAESQQPSEPQGQREKRYVVVPNDGWCIRDTHNHPKYWDLMAGKDRDKAQAKADEMNAAHEAAESRPPQSEAKAEQGEDKPEAEEWYVDAEGGAIIWQRTGEKLTRFSDTEPDGCRSVFGSLQELLEGPRHVERIDRDKAQSIRASWKPASPSPAPAVPTLREAESDHLLLLKAWGSGKAGVRMLWVSDGTIRVETHADKKWWITGPDYALPDKLRVALKNAKDHSDEP